MAIGINVITGKLDFKELPLRILTEAPEDMGEGELVIVKHGTERWLYWKTDGIIYRAKGTKVT